MSEMGDIEPNYINFYIVFWRHFRLDINRRIVESNDDSPVCIFQGTLLTVERSQHERGQRNPVELLMDRSAIALLDCHRQMDWAAGAPAGGRSMDWSFIEQSDWRHIDQW